MIYRSTERVDVEVSVIGLGGHEYLPDGRSRGFNDAPDRATLPGVVGHVSVMPDVHQGYGFPIGGVAATDPELGGVISPGGVGYGRTVRQDDPHAADRRAPALCGLGGRRGRRGPGPRASWPRPAPSAWPRRWACRRRSSA